MNSIWTRSCSIDPRPPLQGDLAAEVVVIGGGLAGILTAYKLKELGKNVVVLEANRIASGQTKNTTAKITAQHGAIYQKLMETVGNDKAGEYALANSRAVAEYKRIIDKHSISCDYEEKDAYLYSLNNEHILRQEAQCAALLGLPASFVTRSALPFPVAGLVRFECQAQFNPLKFIAGIAKDLTIYEDTRAISVSGNTIKTNRGIVTAKQIVFACHFPFINVPGLYFARMHQERSYVIALENAPSLDGMFISADEKGYSFRNYKSYLFLGGKNHRTGENSKGGSYDELESQARKWFPKSHVAARWSAQDCMTADNIPYIGKYSPGIPSWYVATGFNKWGMTTSLAAANILSDLICDIKNPFGAVFAPTRFSFEDIPKIAMEGAQAVKALARENIFIPPTILKNLAIDHGGIVDLDGKKVGVYKAVDGKVYIVNTRCPHLGCQVEWNPDEKSWDCPCHGSRFDYTGQLLDNPAQEDITIE